MPRLSIKTKLSGVMSILVLSFIALFVIYYPKRVEKQLNGRWVIETRQVPENASHAIHPGLRTINAEQYG